MRIAPGCKAEDMEHVEKKGTRLCYKGMAHMAPRSVCTMSVHAKADLDHGPIAIQAVLQYVSPLGVTNVNLIAMADLQQQQQREPKLWPPAVPRARLGQQ